MIVDIFDQYLQKIKICVNHNHMQATLNWVVNNIRQHTINCFL